MKLKFNVFEAHGAGPFPVDMLRYDCAFYNPRHQSTVVIVWWPGLKKAVMNGTPERWRSFGWTIEKPTYVVTDKITADITANLDDWWTLSGRPKMGFTLRDFVDAKSLEALAKITHDIPFWLNDMMVGRQVRRG